MFNVLHLFVPGTDMTLAMDKDIEYKPDSLAFKKINILAAVTLPGKYNANTNCCCNNVSGKYKTAAATMYQKSTTLTQASALNSTNQENTITRTLLL